MPTNYIDRDYFYLAKTFHQGVHSALAQVNSYRKKLRMSKNIELVELGVGPS